MALDQTEVRALLPNAKLPVGVEASQNGDIDLSALLSPGLLKATEGFKEGVTLGLVLNADGTIRKLVPIAASTTPISAPAPPVEQPVPIPAPVPAPVAKIDAPSEVLLRKPDNSRKITVTGTVPSGQPVYRWAIETANGAKLWGDLDKPTATVNDLPDGTTKVRVTVSDKLNPAVTATTLIPIIRS